MVKGQIRPFKLNSHEGEPSREGFYIIKMIKFLNIVSNYTLNKLNIKFYSTNSSNINNLDNNPYLDLIKFKIIETLSLDYINESIKNYVISQIQKSKMEIINSYNLPSIINNSGINTCFSAPLPSGFSTLFNFNNQPGIYFFYSKNRKSSYIGSTVNLYERCRAHFSHSKNAITRHPKFYSFINLYGWESMEIIILTIVKDHEKEFKLKYPNFHLTEQNSALLFLLTKYELLITEQFCIDNLQPTLNINLLVNWGGQPNKGSTGYQVPEDEKLERSLNLRGREFSSFTKELHRKNMTGSTLSDETRTKMSQSRGGVKLLVTQVDSGEQIKFSTKSAAATFFQISVRTITRKCEDGKLFVFNNKSYVFSYDNS